jgi:hypothetical protein
MFFVKISSEDEGEYFDIVASLDEIDEDYQVIDFESFDLRELTFCLDAECENRNNHDFAGAHVALAAMLVKDVGKTVARRVLWQIMEHGGLDAMSGRSWHVKSISEELGQPTNSWDILSPNWQFLRNEEQPQ